MARSERRCETCGKYQDKDLGLPKGERYYCSLVCQLKQEKEDDQRVRVLPFVRKRRDGS